MPTTDVAGVTLYWNEQGEGTPLLFVHGIPTDYRAWDAQVANFSGEFRTVTYSRRYAAPNQRTGDVTDSTVENNAADLAGLIAACGLAPVHLVGHSYGGFVAAYLACRQPDLLRSLTLVEPAIASLLLRNPNSGAEKLGLLFRRPKVALAAQRYLRDSQGPALDALRRNDPAAAVRLNLDGIEDRKGAFELLPPAVRTMVLDNARTIRETDLPYPPLGRSELTKVRTPTLLVHGATSALWLRTIAQEAGAAIPGASVVVVPGTGHFPHLQNPTGFNAALGAFLARVNGARAPS